VNPRLGIAALILLLSGCMLGPDYQAPEIDTPDQFLEAGASGESIANLKWWELFDDPAMNDLITLALEENRDLATAFSRIEEARARYGFERSDLFPTLGGGVQFNRGNTFPGQNVPIGSVQDLYVFGGQLSYEADLFGRVRRSTRAARAELLATEEAARAVMIALIADVASSYLLLRDLDTRLEISQRTVLTRQASLAIIQARYDNGIVPLLDVNQAEIEEADAAAQIASFERAIIETENLINVLVGRNPRPVLRERNRELQMSPPEVPAGLPSELLVRRPDVRQAEQSLSAQTERIGAAVAMRFPTLSLTGVLGLASNDLSDLNSGDAKIWGVGAGLFAPIFDAGKNKRRVEVERAKTEQALNRYEQTILQALREVEDALAGIRTYHDEATARHRQATAARSASMLSRARYDGGVTSYLEVLESDRSLFRAELVESEVRREQLVSVVELYKALGGGWELPAPEHDEQEVAANQ
jgi:multidrug efflux system outer membrane protein